MKTTNKASQHLLILLLISGLLSCGKSSSGGGVVPPPPTEADIVFAIDIDPGSGIYAALGASQDVKITISSRMPPSGITADISVKKDSDNSVVSSATLTSTVSPLTVSLSNLPPGVVCTATFTLTSKTKSTNTATKSFKIARK